MNILGAALIFISCTAMGVIKARSITAANRSLADAIELLSILRREIGSRLAPLSDIFSLAADRYAFADDMLDAMRSLGDEPFSALWRKCAEKNFSAMPYEAFNAFINLGECVGRYDAEAQCAAIERCSDYLAARRDELRRGMDANKRMYLGLGAACGLVIGIVLI